MSSDVEPLGKGDKFGYGSDLHFFHHLMSVCLDRAFRGTQDAGSLPVGLAANYKLENLPLARR
jgi:hypothetical protein